MIPDVLAWRDGVAHTLTAIDWAEISANFLGAGFRIDLPTRSERQGSAQYELSRVRRVADVIGAQFSEADWDLAIGSHLDAEIDVIGGWPRTYSGESTMWIAALPVIDDTDIRTAAVLPLPADQRPTSGLPMFSRLTDQIALASIEADCGLWVDPSGRVVTSTAGPVIAQRADGGWATGTESASWLANRVATERAATADLKLEDLTAARYLGLIRRARDVEPLTYLG